MTNVAFDQDEPKSYRRFRKFLSEHGVDHTHIDGANAEGLIAQLTAVDKLLDNWEEVGQSFAMRVGGGPVRTPDIRPTLFWLRRRITSRLVELGSSEVTAQATPEPLAVEQQRAIQVLLAVTQSDQRAAPIELNWEREMALKQAEADLADRQWTRWFAKDSATVLIGGILLLIMVGTIIGGMASSTPVPEVLTNAFLLVLGFFFGQGARNSKE